MLVNTSPQIMGRTNAQVEQPHRASRSRQALPACRHKYASGPVTYDVQDYETNGVRFDDALLLRSRLRSEMNEARMTASPKGEDALLRRKSSKRSFWQNVRINGQT